MLLLAGARPDMIMMQVQRKGVWVKPARNLRECQKTLKEIQQKWQRRGIIGDVRNIDFTQLVHDETVQGDLSAREFFKITHNPPS